MIQYDAADASLLEAYRWHAHRSGRALLYARGYRRGHRAEGLIYMHRLLLQPPQGLTVVHLNGNGLDNRRENLAVCTRAEAHAQRQRRSGRRAFQGVHYEKSSGKYRAEITKDGRRYRLGRYVEVSAALFAYERAARQLFGDPPDQ